MPTATRLDVDAHGRAQSKTPDESWTISGRQRDGTSVNRRDVDSHLHRLQIRSVWTRRFATPVDGNGWTDRSSRRGVLRGRRGHFDRQPALSFRTSRSATRNEFAAMVSVTGTPPEEGR